MFATLFTVALFALRVIAADDIPFETPTFTQCKDVNIKWGEGKPPYNIIVVSSDNPCADPIYDLGDHDGQSMTWNVALPARDEVMMSLLDSAGNEAWTGPIKVQDSDDDSCVPKELLAAAASSAAAAASSSVAPSSTIVNVNTPVTTPNPTDPTETESGSAVPIGAANAGTNPFDNSDSGARSLTVGGSMIALGSFVGAIALLI